VWYVEYPALKKKENKSDDDDDACESLSHLVSWRRSETSPTLLDQRTARAIDVLRLKFAVGVKVVAFE
jgi:hypothetical protein